MKVLTVVFVVSIVFTLCLIPEPVDANELTYARASEKIQVYSQNDDVAYSTPEYSGDPNWLNYNGCGWFALGHALQWLGIIDKDIENETNESTLLKLFRQSNYMSSVNANGVNRVEKCINWLKTKYSNLGYELFKNNDANVSKIVESLQNNKVVVFSNIGHVVVAVDISSDGNYIHIVDSYLYASRNKGANTFYLYDTKEKSFKPYKMAQQEELSLAAVREVDTAYYGYSYTTKQNLKGLDRKWYAGGDYWLSVDDFFDINEYLCVLWSTCPHSYDTSTGQCTNKCGAVMPCTDAKCEAGVYKAITNLSIRSIPYPLATVSKTVSNGTFLEVREAVENGANHIWYKVWYDGQFCGFVDRDQVTISIQSGNIEEKSYYIKSVNTGKYLTVNGSADANNTALSVSALTQASGQKFAVKLSNYSYTIRPLSSSTTERFLNPYYKTATIESGNEVVIASAAWEANNDQHWCFQSVSGGYIIRNMRDPSLVLSVVDNSVVVEKTSILTVLPKQQIWILEPVSSSEPTLSSISVDSLPAKTRYEVGEALDTTGLKIKLTYSDGSTKIINSGFTTSNFNSTAAGTIMVKVSYGGKNCEFPVNIVPAATSAQYTYVSLNPGAYYLINKSTGKYLNADGTASKSNISVAAYAGRAVQCFMLDGANKSYTLSASFTEGLNLNPFSDNAVSGTNVNLFVSSAETGNDQHWGFEAVYSGDNNNTYYYKIHNMQYQNLVLGIQDGGSNVQAETAANAEDQLWELVPAYEYVEITTGSFYLSNKAKGTYLTAESVASKSAVKLAALARSNEQQLVVDELDSMYVISMKANPDLRLNPSADLLTGGVSINLYSRQAELNFDQHWYFQEVSGGYIIHNAKVQGLVLGIDSNGKVRIEHYSESGTQTWVLHPLVNIVSYNSNGGSGAPAYQTKQHGASITLSSTKPTKEYTVTFDGKGGNVDNATQTKFATFKNWNSAKNGTGTNYSPGATYSANEDIVLYAQWNTPSIGNLPSASWSGYKFLGWYTEDGKTKITTSTVITSDTTFIAKWEKEEVQKYYIDINGYLDGNVKDSLKLNNVVFGTVDIYVDGVLVANDVVDYYTAFPAGSQYEIKDIKATAGHTYTGLRKGKLSGTISSSTTDIVLIFDTLKYTVSYNANGGTGAPAAQTKNYGETLTLSSTKPTRSGYIFEGWSTNKNATAATYALGSQFTADENVTLYAVWNTVSVTSVSIDTKPTQTDYWVGDNLNTSGLKLKVTYSDGTTKIVSSGFTTSGFSSDSAGTKTVNVLFNGKSASFSVTVKAVTVSSIAIKSKPNKTTYWIGEDLDTTGLSISVSYSNGTEKTIVSGFSTQGFNSEISGTKTVEVNFEGKKASFNVTVQSVSIVSVSINTLPKKTTYWVGEEFDSSGLTLTVINSNGTEETVSEGFTTKGFSSTVSGEKTITVTYAGKEALFSVIVSNVTLVSIEIASLPQRLSYLVGEEPDMTGLVLRAKSSDGAEEIITTGFEIVGFDTATAGLKTVTVKYGEKTASFSVLVNDIVLVLSYDSRGGSITPPPQSVTKGTTLSLSSIIPEKEGFEFKGWALSNDASEADYQAGATITVNTNTQLYAVWASITAPTADVTPTEAIVATPTAAAMTTEEPTTDPVHAQDNLPTVSQEPEQASASLPPEDTPKESNGNKNTQSIVFIIVAVALLAIAAILFLLIKKKAKE